MNGTGTGPAVRPEITVDRLHRLLIGQNSERVKLPALSLRLLEELALASPDHVPADHLLHAVWRHPHLSPDTLKQRVRLLRESLRKAGYDPGLLDNVRGEGYALRAHLREPAPDTATINRPFVASSRGRWLMIALALVATVIVAGAVVLLMRNNAKLQAHIGPSPVRLGVLAARHDPMASLVREQLVGTSHLLLVPMDIEGDACRDSEAVHLCLILSADSTASGQYRLSLIQTSSGAVLLQRDNLGLDDANALSVFLLQLSQFTVPGALRWLGGRTGAGDRTFTRYREGVLLLGQCDRAAQADVVHQLDAAAEESPHYVPVQALALFMHFDSRLNLERETATESGHAAVDERCVDCGKDPSALFERARQLQELAPDQALAQLAWALALGTNAPFAEIDATQALERAIHLQPVLRNFVATDDQQIDLLGHCDRRQ